MDHTPAVAAGDERALRLLDRMAVDEPHREALKQLVLHAQNAAQNAGADLQSEVGREHVGLIIGCNQFLRLWRDGPGAGHAEILLDVAARAALPAAGFPLTPPDGAVFKMFGWVRFDPTEGDATALAPLVDKAFAKAQAAKKK